MSRGLNDGTVLPLYPSGGAARPLEGLYLAHGLHRAPRPLVYTNFITSLDGRIAVRDHARATYAVPATLGNARDWWLFQELAAQADVIVVSARYLRQLAQGTAQDELPISSKPRYAPLRMWRARQNLAPQPALAVISASLDIPLDILTAIHDRPCCVLTGSGADSVRRARIEALGVSVLTAGAGTRAEGARLTAQLRARGYRAIYAMAGPEVFHTLVEGRVLDRLYLTLRHRLLGGEDYSPLVRGASLEPPAELNLAELYYDAAGGQSFAVYDFAAAANQV